MIAAQHESSLPDYNRVDSGDGRLVGTALAFGGLCISIMVSLLGGKIPYDKWETAATRLGAVAFVVAFCVPYLIAILAGIATRSWVRRPIWLACAILTLLLGGVTIFGGIGILYLMVGGWLLGIWWTSRSTFDPAMRWQSVLLTSWMIQWCGLSLFVLQIRTTEKYVESPTRNWYTSDIVDNTEASLSLLCVVIGLLGIFTMLRFLRLPKTVGES